MDESKERENAIGRDDAAYRRLLEIAADWLESPDVMAEYEEWAEREHSN